MIRVFRFGGKTILAIFPENEDVEIHQVPSLCKWNGNSNFQFKALGQCMHQYLSSNPVIEEHLHKGYFEVALAQLKVPGHGEDATGKRYLCNIENIVGRSCAFLYTDGDGNCLVHALSKAIVGTEILWYSLRIKLVSMLRENKQKFLELLKHCDYEKEWDQICNEARPDYHSTNEGLQLIHLFGLANVLRRPIILLDSADSKKESGLYLPLLYKPEECISKNPLVIAWRGPDHFISVVPVNGHSPLLPLECVAMTEEDVPNIWGVTENLFEVMIEYVEICNSVNGRSGLNFVLGGHHVNDTKSITNDVNQIYKSTYGVSTNYVCEIAKALAAFRGFQEAVFMSKTDEILSEAMDHVGELLYCSKCTCNALLSRPKPCDCPLEALRPYNHNTDQFEYKIGDTLPAWSNPCDGKTKRYCVNLDGQPIAVDRYVTLELRGHRCYWTEDESNVEFNSNINQVAEYFSRLCTDIDPRVIAGEVQDAIGEWRMYRLLRQADLSNIINPYVHPSFQTEAEVSTPRTDDEQNIEHQPRSTIEMEEQHENENHQQVIENQTNEAQLNANVGVDESLALQCVESECQQSVSDNQNNNGQPDLTPEMENEELNHQQNIESQLEVTMKIMESTQQLSQNNSTESEVNNEAALVQTGESHDSDTDSECEDVQYQQKLMVRFEYKLQVNEKEFNENNSVEDLYEYARTNFDIANTSDLTIKACRPPYKWVDVPRNNQTLRQANLNHRDRLRVERNNHILPQYAAS